ncbi:MAG: RNase adapter RapZ [Bacteroidales bacterium]|jgi:RNase adaptor protein for sRNA GlmZ degradation|nr:RNase adapter RapZ [Bacteroidales bacterium]
MNHKLTITINSFSYKRSIPYDKSGNGGGFVFDCRAIPNPGRVEEYKALSGLDNEIKSYLDGEPEMQKFLKNVFELVDQSVGIYLTREFESLMVNFGCTGGQHRSVYAAEKLAGYLNKKDNVIVKLKHVELDRKKSL